MKIGIFSKIGASGGSEHRVAEMANGIIKYTNHGCQILCEKGISKIISDKVDPNVKIIKNIFKGENPTPEKLYNVDSLLVVNSDSYSFAKRDYWEGKGLIKKNNTYHHKFFVNLKKIPQMIFLFNFVISPSKHLYTIAEACNDVRMICANKKFYREIEEKEKKFDKIKHIPRILLNSPIDPDSVATKKHSSEFIRIGKHSKPHGYKYDPECTKLIKKINKKYKDKILWDFMGIPNEYKKDLKNIDNIIIREQFSISVKEYLKGIDIFLFFISWGRNEPWARVIAEGMGASCPILANNKAGNRDQVLHRNNGFLCDSLDDFEKNLIYLLENPEIIKIMGKNSKIYSQEFTTEKIIKKYIDFITG